MKIKSGIYVIENIKNGKKYYGQGLNVKKRMWQSHKGCNIIYDAIKKHGDENFDRRVFIYCEEWELTRLEIACIKIFHSHVSEGGYNISWGGDAPMRGRNHPLKTIVFYNDGHRKGKIVSNITRERLSIALTGKKYKSPSKETKEKRRKTMELNKNNRIKWVPSNETRKIWSKQRLGKKPKNSSSIYHGLVKRLTKKGKTCWDIGVKINGKRVHIGRRYNEIEGAKLFDKYIIEHNLPNPLNFPLDKK